MSDEMKPVVVANPWSKLRQYTPARIALGRAGTSLPTKPHLEFQLAHARARNAVHHELDTAALETTLKTRGHETQVLHSAAENRPMYLQRPDKGRRLDDASRKQLGDMAPRTGSYDVAFVIGDGLSSFAIEENAAPFLDAILPPLVKEGWRIAPLVIIREARVAVGDEIGQLLGARMVVVLIGERPGLSSPDSMGIYMTLNPRVGLTDEARNCISNVRREGLDYDGAAHKLFYLMTEARKRGLSGVHLKDEAETVQGAVSGSNKSFLIEPNDPMPNSSRER
ncbi:ethanolamine ammonia-lyase small subunit [Hyphomicrobium denitrificans 1NES1]|uniref:Ethanolamine ammonia-lyase small subunit n=1 Tax=Hyphomicrobium denitrificans 1NES1 TaxID=670307 RepID=N0B7B8_9HYPH|nr:ethanolamine ammonia-lyase subunit EutC [Hyphomicrobium denitrificans]AGK58147.1 ethanolamine ammonia-lyase small subunit [Hyphomicrobium denitrificans 1NES1]